MCKKEKHRFSFKVALTLLLAIMFSIGPMGPGTQQSVKASDPPLDAATLQALFDGAAANSTVTLPSGTYDLNNYIQLPRASNVTINASNATFTGTVTFLSAGNSGMTWNGGTFEGTGISPYKLGFTLLHVTNATFDGMKFNRAVSFGQHIFDLLGSTNITFQNIVAAGYGDTTDLTGLSAHDKYAEAIQTDYAISGASGSTNSENLLLQYGGTFDGAATANIVVQQCQFVPYVVGSQTVAWAQSPIGQHVYGKNVQNHDITFKQNIVRNPIPLNAISQNKYTGALHFVSVKNLHIYDNTFTALGNSAQRENWIEVVNRANSTNPGDGAGELPTSGVDITGNTFVGVAPTASFINLTSDKNNALFKITGTKITNNAYRNNAALEPTNWISIADVGSQIDTPKEYANHGEFITYSSSFESSGWSYANVFDGIHSFVTGTYGWSSNNSTSVNHTEWIKLDFGSNKSIGRVNLYPRNDAPYAGDGFPIDFTIQLSTDNINWTTKVTKTGYAKPGSDVQSFTFTPQSARYVKIIGTNLRIVGGQYRMQFAEIEPLDTNDTVSGVTYSSSFQSSGWSYAFMHDGIYSSVTGALGWSSSSNTSVNHTEWINLDLGSNKSVGRIDLYPRNDASYAGDGFPIDFTIEVSTDNVNWTTKVTKTGYAKPGSDVQSFTFTSQSARYIKITGTNLRIVRGDYRMQFAEVELY